MGLASEDEPVAELTMPAEIAREPWMQPHGSLQQSLSLGSQHSYDAAPVNLQQPAIYAVSVGSSSFHLPPGVGQHSGYFAGAGSFSQAKSLSRATSFSQT